jgi:hypothetical protein
MFVRAGFFLAREPDLMPAADSNPLGHFEHLEIFDLNERILERLGGSWFDPPPAATQLDAASWAAPLIRAQIERLLEQAGAMPLVVKDPRIGVTMPLWEPLIAERMHPVLVVRHPIEIARSLRDRDGTPIPFGLAAWELHLIELLGHLQGKLVTVVPHRWLLADSGSPTAAVQAAAAHIERDRARSVHPELAPEALMPALHRQRSADGDESGWLTTRQLELWRALDRLAPGDQIIDIPDAIRTPSTRVRETVAEETRRRALADELRAAQALSTGTEPRVDPAPSVASEPMLGAAPSLSTPAHG